MIFVYSGTGNSYSVARRIGDAAGIPLTDLAAAVRYGRFSYDAKGEDVGFVFPTFFLGLPDKVRAFAEKVSIKNPGHVFAVSTCGGRSGGACDMLAELLDGRLKIDAMYDAKMPDSAIFAFEPPSQEEEAEILRASDAESEEIAQSVKSSACGDFRRHRGDLDWRSVYPKYDEARVTEPFAVTDKCIECRICEDICPDQAIRVYHRKPVWDEEKCGLCMSCLQICPKQAIEYGESTVGRRRSFNKAYYERSIGIPLRYG